MRNIKLTSPIFLSSCFFLTVLIIRFFSDFNGLYGQDSHEYLRFAERLRIFLEEGQHPGIFFWPVNYPLDAAILAIFLRDSAISAQLISMLAASATIWMTSSYLQSVYPNALGRTSYILILLLLSPLFFTNSLLIMSDMLAAAFIMATFFMAHRLRTRPTDNGYILLLFYAACAVTTRYAVAPLIALPVIFFLRIQMSTFRPLFLIKCALFSLAPAIPHMLLRGGESSAFLAHPWLVSWSLGNWPIRSFQTLDGFANYTLPNIVYAGSALFHPGFILPGFILLLCLRPVDIKKNFLLIGSIALYGLFLAGVPFQNLRFLLPAFPLCFIVLFPGWQRLHKWLPSTRFRYALYLLLIVTQLLLIMRYANPLYQANKLEKTIALEIKQQDNLPIYTFWIDLSLRSYDVKNEIINLYYEKLAAAKTPSLLLFNPQKFAVQWQGKNPMLNWEFLKTTYSLQPVKVLPQGWTLYKVAEIATNTVPETPGAR
ncbi:MAG: hypothetical protein ACRBF0_20180 [Calditrichia bacterium]